MPDVQSMVSLLGLFGDPTRVRLMVLLSDEELTVAEITRITDLPQSRVSTHLGKLRDAGLLRDRKNGASTYYTVNEPAMPAEARKMWEVVRGQLEDSVLNSDRERRDAAVVARQQGAPWPDAIAGQMEHHYSPGRTWEATARGLLGLLRLGDVLDVGSGDGVIAQLLATRARSITCVDRSERVIDAARKRLAKYPHVRFLVGDMHDLEFADASFDQVLLFNVLTYASSPVRALEQAYRVLRPGGDLAAITLHEHLHSDIASAYRHVNTGFDPSLLRERLESAGFLVEACDVTSRERRRPYFEIISAFAHKPPAAHANAS